MIARRLAPTLQRSAKSLLLLGPRQTGKSTLVAQLEPDLTINKLGSRWTSDFFGKKHHSLVLYLGTERRRLEGIDVFPWQEGLQTIGL